MAISFASWPRPGSCWARCLGWLARFAPSADSRDLAWGIDGTAIVVACALLTAHHLRVRIFGGATLTPLSTPLPFCAYPFLALTLVGWAWAHLPRAWPRASGGLGT